jgi:outer membrane lipoprotein LolB
VIRRLLSILGLGMVLAGCAQAPVQPDAAAARERAWEAHRAEVSQLGTWTLTGRISLSSETEAWNATLRWRQNDTRYDILLIGPLGQGSLAVRGDDRSVVLKTSDGKTATAPDPEGLLARHLGWRLPLEGLQHWVLGLPEPGLRAERVLDETGRLAELTQAGWTLQFLRYDPVDGVMLPGKIFLENAEWKVRLVVERWAVRDREVARGL